MRRRDLLLGAGFVTVTPFLLRAAADKGVETMQDIQELQSDWISYAPDSVDPNPSLEPIERSEAEWRDALGEDAFRVLRKEGTEKPFTSPLNDVHDKGLFVCAGCELPLFTSAMKFDSGTGWPSFFTAIEAHFGTKRDFKLVWPRTEYHCIRCGGHQGHVFDDGPRPTGQRWCNNGVALKFLSA